jgi:DNA topoisomerase-1
MNHELYLSDPGIRLHGRIFYFNKNNAQVTDKVILDRISKFRVPPAWKNVWYSSNKKCHIQVHGTDASGKKQYILSDEWIRTAKCKKFERMKTFIKNISSFKRKIKLFPPMNDTLSREVLIKLLFNLLIYTHIRVGNEIYAEQNKTYGLTTMLQKHLIFKKDHYYFSFVGKSKITHEVRIPKEYYPYLRKLILSNKNKPLFYYLSGGKTCVISSEELNNFLKDTMGEEYTCKDFRTYSANVLFIKYFLLNVKKKESHGGKKIILSSIDSSAKHLGHTRNISRKSYISDTLLNYCFDSFESASKESSGSLLTKVWET